MGCEVEHCDEAATVTLTYRWFPPLGRYYEIPVRLCARCAAECLATDLEAVTIQAEALT